MSDDLRKLIEAVEAGRDIFPSDFPPEFPKRQWAIRAYEGSVDAAITFCEALLPGWQWFIGMGGAAVYYDPDSEDGLSCEVQETNPARALLLATLRAYHKPGV